MHTVSGKVMRRPLNYRLADEKSLMTSVLTSQCMGNVLKLQNEEQNRKDPKDPNFKKLITLTASKRILECCIPVLRQRGSICQGRG